MHREGGGRRRQRFGVGVICILLGGAPLDAQSPARFDHWTQIRSAWERAGGIGQLSRLSVDAARALAQEHFLRGQFYADWHEMNAEILLRYAEHLDSLGKSEGVSLAAAPYYRGRALLELGRAAEATTALADVPADSPLAARARLWRGTVGASGGNGAAWQVSAAEWRRGRSSALPACLAGDRACALYVAIRRGDHAAMYEAHEALTRTPGTDYVQTRRSEGRTDSVSFGDPMIPALLAASDFAIAAALYARVPGAEVNRAVALMRSGATAEALPILRAAADRSTSEVVLAYLGEALTRSGDARAGAEAWGRVQSRARHIVWEAKGLLDPDRRGIERFFGQLPAADVRQMRSAAFFGPNLARGLLRHGEPEAALAVMEFVSPTSVGFDLREIAPFNIVLLARARFGVATIPRGGRRDQFGLTLAALSTLAAEVPLLLRPHQMVQELAIGANDSQVRR